MTPNVEPLRASKQDGSTREFCAACGYSEFVHEGNRGCRYSVCDCNRSSWARKRDGPLGKVPPPWHPRLLPEGLGHRHKIGPQPFGLLPWSLYAVAESQASATARGGLCGL